MTYRTPNQSTISGLIDDKINSEITNPEKLKPGPSRNLLEEIDPSQPKLPTPDDPPSSSSENSNESLNISQNKNITHRKKEKKENDSKKLYGIKVKYELQQNLETIDEDSFEVQTEYLQLETLKATIENNFRKSLISRRNLSNWSFDSNMAAPIKDITELIKEYKGDEKGLNSYIKNIDKLWSYIEEYDENDKNRFLLVLQLKLTEKAAEATQDVEFDQWETVKKALKENIKPQKNIEKAELKLTAVKQMPREELETYAKRVEDLMEDLNKCFELEDGYELMKKENARKARKAFENGLNNSSLKNKAITKGCKSLNDVVDYVIEQELRLPESKSIEKYCTFCKIQNHNISECRRKAQMDEAHE